MQLIVNNLNDNSSDKREDKRNGSGSKSSRKKSPDKEKERSKSKEKALKSESSEYDPGTVDKVSFVFMIPLNNGFLLQCVIYYVCLKFIGY